MEAKQLFGNIPSGPHQVKVTDILGNYALAALSKTVAFHKNWSVYAGCSDGTSGACKKQGDLLTQEPTLHVCTKCNFTICGQQGTDSTE